LFGCKKATAQSMAEPNRTSETSPEAPVIVVDKSVCIGNGMCAGFAPAYFALGEGSQVSVLRSDVAAEDAEAVDNAVVSCPSGAITLRRPVNN
jgi:ferredoxin